MMKVNWRNVRKGIIAPFGFANIYMAMSSALYSSLAGVNSQDGKREL
jgi:hypothetical protein